MSTFPLVLKYTIPHLANIITSIMGSRSTKQSLDTTNLTNKINKLQSELTNVNDDNRKKREDLINEQNKLKEELNRLLKHNENLNNMITDLNKQISRLNDIANKDMKKYDEIKNYFDENIIRIIRTDNSVIVGPKGHGKSSFLWIKGICDRPTKTYNDGTTELVLENKFIDTIGINMELNLLLKMIAVLIVKGLPRSLILCINDGIERALILFSHLLIKKMYIVIIDPKYLHKKYDKKKDFSLLNKKELYDLQAYKEIKEIESGCIVPIDHNEEINNIGSFDNIIDQLFCDGIKLNDWSDFHNSNNTLQTIKYQICKNIYDYKINFKENDKGFLN